MDDPKLGVTFYQSYDRSQKVIIPSYSSHTELATRLDNGPNGIKIDLHALGGTPHHYLEEYTDLCYTTVQHATGSYSSDISLSFYGIGQWTANDNFAATVRV